MSVRQGQFGHSQLPVTSLYRKLEVIGKGAYGAVYKGIHIPTNSVVALKIIDLDTADDDVADIQREVALLSQLRSENNNITTYYGCWLEGPRVWIAMDFASGGSVRTLMKCLKGGILEERWIAIIIRELLVALSYLHKSNVIHRDIKAANILIQSNGKVILCDFGVSALLSTSHSKRTTFIGTPHYMAPEVLTSSSYDNKADVWSLGISLYEMATGLQPLAEIPQLKAIDLIPKIKPPRLTEQQGSKDLRDFLANCLRELPTDRLSADELARTKWMKSISKMPCSILEELLVRYNRWTQAGGIRQSLAQPAPWEIEAERSNSQEDWSDGSAWEFETLRASSTYPQERETDESMRTFSPTGQLPESLRMLFDTDDSMPSSTSEPYLANDFGVSRSSGSLAMTSSFASLPDLSRTLNEDTDATARNPRHIQHSRASPASFDLGASSEPEQSIEPLRIIPRSREPRANRGLAELSINNGSTPSQPQQHGLLSSDSGGSPLSSRSEQSIPSEPTNIETAIETARPRRRRASPLNFQFPRATAPTEKREEKREVQNALSPSNIDQRTPLPATPTTLHQTTASLEYATERMKEASANIGGSHSAHPSLTGTDVKAADLGIARKPSLNRQMSVAVMENMESTSARNLSPMSHPPILSRGRTVGSPLAGRGDAPDSSASTSSSVLHPTQAKPMLGLKDFLKLSSMPLDKLQALGPDMLPPSPSIMSPPAARAFNPSPSALSGLRGTPTIATTNAYSNSHPFGGPSSSSTASSSPLTSDNLRTAEMSISSNHSHSLTQTSITSNSQSSSDLAALGPSIRPLDYATLLQSRSVMQTELSRTVDDLAQWLSIIETGLTGILCPSSESPTSWDDIAEEDSLSRPSDEELQAIARDYDVDDRSAFANGVMYAARQQQQNIGLNSPPIMRGGRPP